MKFCTDLNNFSAVKPVLTVGTFDGIHRGHTKVLAGLIRKAKEIGGESVVLTFVIHPRTVLNPDNKEIKLLNTLEEKIDLFTKSGIDHLIAIPFTKEFSQLSYEEFVKSYLVDKIKIDTLIVGHDHQFGKNREGGGNKLVQLAEKFHFNLVTIDALIVEETNISSTKIRNSLAIGHISRANEYLGYSYSISGKVTMGKQLGRTINFPTANIALEDSNKLIPSNGVYAVYIEIDKKRFKGMLNIGHRPTIEQSGIPEITVEVNIFDFDQDIYNKSITIIFEEWLRPEEKFQGLEELKLQLAKDKLKAIKILA